MTTLSKSLDCGGRARGDGDFGILSSALRFNPGMAYMYSGPGEMTTMAHGVWRQKSRCDDEGRQEGAERGLHGRPVYMPPDHPTGNFYGPAPKRAALGAA